MASNDEYLLPWKLSDILLTFLVGLGLAIGLSIIGFIGVQLSDSSVSDPIPLSITTMLVYAGFLIAAFLMVVKRRRVSMREIGLVPVSKGTLALMVPVYVGTLVAMGLVIAATTPLLGEPPPTSQQLVLDERISLSLAESSVLLLDAAIVAPFVEELLFRGLIYRYLRSRWGVRAGVITSSVLFALVHPYLPLMPAIFVLGAVLAFVTERYGSLYPAVLLHGLTNGVAVISLAAS